MIYLIKSGRYTKIGTTKKLGKRLGTLQTGNPKRLLVLAVGNGGRKEELLLQLRFNRLRVLHRREWFNLSWWHIGWLILHLNAKCYTKYAQRCKSVYRALFWADAF